MCQTVIAEEYTRETMPGAQYYDGKKMVIPISKEAGQELFEHWTSQAISSLMTAIATKKAKKLEVADKSRLELCSKKADTVNKHAKCMIKLLDAEKWRKKKLQHGRSRLELLNKRVISAKDRIVVDNNLKPFYEWNAKFRTKRPFQETTQQSPHEARTSSTNTDDEGKQADEWVGGFMVRRAKRRVQTRDSYTLLTEDSGRTPFGMIAKYLTKTLQQIKQKNNPISWASTLAEIKELGREMREQNAHKKALLHQIESMADGQLKNVPIDERRQRGRAITADVEHDNGIPFEMEEMLRPIMKPTNEEDKLMGQPLKLLRDGVKLGMMIAGQNVSGFENKTIKMVSPRLFSIVPEGNKDEVRVSKF
ncbi:unnamed protein product [Toxocara canis]|uniref:Reverse transcriptase domain-containing protein n=1 Tax=Toxocara canis TaxID=6265 RepID=A0A183U0S7_TOXCA|nr:unnamed protein product [Toxocara canis]